MAKKDKQTDQRAGKRARAAEQAVRDLPVRPDEADKVKGGAVGPCFRPK